jgi:hypothetical protein
MAMTEEKAPPGADELDEKESGEVDGMTNYYEEKTDVRADIDTAISVYNFLDQIDPQATDVLKWGMKDQVIQAKKQCLQIICESLNNLQSPDEDEEEK